jgi:hypothetical protein
MGAWTAADVLLRRRNADSVGTINSLRCNATSCDDDRNRNMRQFDSNASSCVQSVFSRKGQNLRGSGPVGEQRMNWSRAFRRPIALKGGDEIVTLAGALALMRSLPNAERYGALRRDVEELLVEAAMDTRWMPDAEAQLSQVLREEEMLWVINSATSTIEKAVAP